MKIKVLCCWERMGDDGTYEAGHEAVECTNKVASVSTQGIVNHVTHHLKETYGEDAHYFVEVISFVVIEQDQPKPQPLPPPSRLNYFFAGLFGGCGGVLVARLIDHLANN